MLLFLVYFSIAIRIVESGYQRGLRFKDFNLDPEFEAEWVNRGTFDNYKNSIWNMFITMSTIGYGEFNV